MDYATTEKPSEGKSKRLKKKKVAPRKGGYFFAQKFFDTNCADTNL